MKKSSLTRVHGEPSYELANNDVELYLTRRAGHMAPVRFRLGKRWVQPYTLSPWEPQDSLVSKAPPIIQVLRGDYFCLPFGGGKNIKDVHGETANENWNLIQQDSENLVLDMKLGTPRCRVQKTLGIRKDQRAVYQEHLIEGLSGRFNFGHHAILLFPEKGGPYHVNTSPFKYGSVKPEAFSNPLNREYGALKTGARFKSLSKVPLANGGVTSLHEYPARQGFEDLIMVSSKKGDFAWSAATLDGYVWISLKDPRTLPSTLFWISNGGRHGEPWNGTHLHRLALEEVCGHFSDGLEISREDRLKKFGVPTTRAFKADKPVSIRNIHVVHPVPKDFGKVFSVTRNKDATITVRGEKGMVKIPVDWSFLYG